MSDAWGDAARVWWLRFTGSFELFDNARRNALRRWLPRRNTTNACCLNGQVKVPQDAPPSTPAPLGPRCQQPSQMGQVSLDTNAPCIVLRRSVSLLAPMQASDSRRCRPWPIAARTSFWRADRFNAAPSPQRCIRQALQFARASGFSRLMTGDPWIFTWCSHFGSGGGGRAAAAAGLLARPGGGR